VLFSLPSFDMPSSPKGMLPEYGCYDVGWQVLQGADCLPANSKTSRNRAKKRASFMKKTEVAGRLVDTYEVLMCVHAVLHQCPLWRPLTASLMQWPGPVMQMMAIFVFSDGLLGAG